MTNAKNTSEFQYKVYVKFNNTNCYDNHEFNFPKYNIRKCKFC